MNILPLPNTLKGLLILESEFKEQKQASMSKGKQKEVRVDLDEDDEVPAERIWLGSDTPYKGLNKWFGGGRLKSRTSMSTTTAATKPMKMNQNVLFGIATQIPIWADNSPSDPRKSTAAPPQKLHEWPKCQPPPHIASSSCRRSATGSNDWHMDEPPRNLQDNVPPDDGGMMVIAMVAVAVNVVVEAEGILDKELQVQIHPDADRDSRILHLNQVMVMTRIQVLALNQMSLILRALLV